jgi:hypothetical protein
MEWLPILRQSFDYYVGKLPVNSLVVSTPSDLILISYWRSNSADLI